jgi:hypothetical protein
MKHLSPRELAGLVVIGVALLSLTTWIVVNGAAYGQKDTQVATREPGDRFLSAPRPLEEEALKDVDFALLSQAAYQEKPGAKTGDQECDAEQALAKLGWTRWQGFPNDELSSKIAKSHLRIGVWQNDRRGIVAVGFGGTVFQDKADWRANFRWFLPFRNDEYTELVKEAGPAFVAEFTARQKTGTMSAIKQVVSTGHSLGGGLAQQFAYALPINNSVPRVTAVYAFDPSPVTGYYSVEPHIRCANSSGLYIDRIYERGEILATLRALTNAVYKPSSANPTIRQVRYNLFHSNPISGHSIADLACKLYRVTTRNQENAVK